MRAVAPHVRWVGPGEMAVSNHATRVDGRVLHVRMHSRRASVEIPDGVDTLRMELPEGGQVGEDIGVARGVRRADLHISHDEALDPNEIPAPSWTPWPLARRLAVEGRDRLAPIYRRASRKVARRDRDGLPVASSARATTR